MGRRADIRITVQCARGNNGDAEIGRPTRQWATAVFAKNRPVSCRVRHFETADGILAGGPLCGIRLEDDIAGVTRACRFSTTLAMTVKERSEFPRNHVLDGTANTASRVIF